MRGVRLDELEGAPPAQDSLVTGRLPFTVTLVQPALDRIDSPADSALNADFASTRT
jgi:hypothetical protein